MTTKPTPPSDPFTIGDAIACIRRLFHLTTSNGGFDMTLEQRVHNLEEEEFARTAVTFAIICLFLGLMICHGVPRLLAPPRVLEFNANSSGKLSIAIEEENNTVVVKDYSGDSIARMPLKGPGRGRVALYGYDGKALYVSPGD